MKTGLGDKVDSGKSVGSPRPASGGNDTEHQPPPKPGLGEDRAAVLAEGGDIRTEDKTKTGLGES